MNQSIDLVIRNLKNMGYNMTIPQNHLAAGFETNPILAEIETTKILEIVEAKITVDEVKIIPKML